MNSEIEVRPLDIDFQLYMLLDVSPTATRREIRNAWQRKMNTVQNRLPPGYTGDAMERAWEILMDIEARKKYNELSNLEPPPPVILDKELGQYYTNRKRELADVRGQVADIKARNVNTGWFKYRAPLENPAKQRDVVLIDDAMFDMENKAKQLKKTLEGVRKQASSLEEEIARVEGSSQKLLHIVTWEHLEERYGGLDMEW